MAGLVPAIDVMTARYCILANSRRPRWYTCCGCSRDPAIADPDMLSRPPLRLKRGRTKSKTVERCLLAKRPDWQPVLTPAGPPVQKRCSMSWSDKPRQGLTLEKCTRRKPIRPLTSVPLAKAGTLDEAQVIG